MSGTPTPTPTQDPDVWADRVLTAYREIDYTPVSHVYVEPSLHTCCALTALVLAESGLSESEVLDVVPGITHGLTYNEGFRELVEQTTGLTLDEQRAFEWGFMLHREYHEGCEWANAAGKAARRLVYDKFDIEPIRD